mmetsp:Transcript_130325/g.259960  ORF Transcript_130325/g.259960 Transcript_130325/m.259960 type:complete len:115 (+) Transcript_130325:1056-1400(+)
MHEERGWVGVAVLPLGECPWASDPSDSVQEESSPTHPVVSQTKPQLSPKPTGVPQPELATGKPGLRHKMDVPAPSSRNRDEWIAVSDGMRAKPKGGGGDAARDDAPRPCPAPQR